MHSRAASLLLRINAAEKSSVLKIGIDCKGLRSGRAPQVTHGLTCTKIEESKDEKLCVLNKQNGYQDKTLKTLQERQKRSKSTKELHAERAVSQTKQADSR